MLPAQIRALRERCKDTQPEFAARIGVGLRTVCNWESGNTTPTFLGLVRLNQIRRQADMPAVAGVEV